MNDGAVLDSVLTNQVIGEFFNVIRKRSLGSLERARATVSDWNLLYPIAPISTRHLIEASALSERSRLQFWDAVFVTVSRGAGADFLISEDMQDGSAPGGVQIVNPFDPANADLLDQLLTPVPGTA